MEPISLTYALAGVVAASGVIIVAALLWRRHRQGVGRSRIREQAPAKTLSQD